MPLPPALRFEMPPWDKEPPSQPHPDHELVVAASEAWLRDHLHEHFDGDTGSVRAGFDLRTSWQACLMYPAASADRIPHLANMTLPTRLVAQMFATLAVCGDHISTVLVRQRLQQAISTGRADGFPLGTMLIESLRAALALAPQQTAARYVETWVAVLDRAAGLALAGDREIHETDVGYLKMRRAGIFGSWPALHVEYALGLDLSTELASIDALRFLRDAATDHVILVRDLYCWRDDRIRANCDNVMWVLLGPHQFAPATAPFAVKGLIEDASERFEASYRALLGGLMSAHPAFDAYVAGLRSMMAGNLRYYLRMHELAGISAPDGPLQQSGEEKA